jgi:hypothetical protein
MLLFRPVNPAELDLIIDTGWVKFPPILEGQPIFYPVLNKAYAEQITREQNVPAFKKGYVLKFDVNDEFLDQYEVHQVGLDHYLEYWIPAEDLEGMNDNIVGRIELVSSFDS